METCCDNVTQYNTTKTTVLIIHADFVGQRSLCSTWISWLNCSATGGIPISDTGLYGPIRIRIRIRM